MVEGGSCKSGNCRLPHCESTTITGNRSSPFSVRTYSCLSDVPKDTLCLRISASVNLVRRSERMLVAIPSVRHNSVKWQVRWKTAISTKYVQRSPRTSTASCTNKPWLSGMEEIAPERRRRRGWRYGSPTSLERSSNLTCSAVTVSPHFPHTHRGSVLLLHERWKSVISPTIASTPAPQRRSQWR